MNDKNTSNTKNLWDAVNSKNIPLITQLVKSGVDVNAKNNSGLTALHIAAQNGDALVCKELLKCANIRVDAGSNPAGSNYKRNQDYYYKNTGRVQLYTLSTDKEEDDKDLMEEHAALNFRIIGGHVVNPTLYLAEKATNRMFESEQVASEKATPLAQAVRGGHMKASLYLLARGAKLCPFINRGYWPILTEAVNKQNKKMLYFLFPPTLWSLFAYECHLDHVFHDKDPNGFLLSKLCSTDKPINSVDVWNINGSYIHDTPYAKKILGACKKAADLYPALLSSEALTLKEGQKFAQKISSKGENRPLYIDIKNRCFDYFENIQDCYGGALLYTCKALNAILTNGSGELYISDMLIPKEVIQAICSYLPSVSAGQDKRYYMEYCLGQNI